MSAPTAIRLDNGVLTLLVARRGAEITSLRDPDGEWIWSGDSAFWARQAPVLFPIIGAVPGGTVQYGGQPFPMPSHGVAPTSEFEVLRQETDRVELALTESEASLAHFPFPFRLRIEYALADRHVTMRARVENRGTAAMPFAVGFHPGFALPFPSAEVGYWTDYVLRLDAPEPDLNRVTPGGLVARPGSLAIGGCDLPLDALRLEEGALVLGRVRSRRLWLGRPAERGIAFDLGDFPQFGIWSKPGAPFLCIEPWQGLPVPAGFAGEVAQMPGITNIEPGAARSWQCRFTVGAAHPESALP